MSRSPEALALGPAVISFRRRYHCPAPGAFAFASRPSGFHHFCERRLPRKPFSRRIHGVTVAGSGGIDPSRKSRSCPPGQKRKTGPLCSSHLHKGPALSYLAAIPNGCKGRFGSFGRFRFASGLRPGGGNLSVATTSFSLKSSLPPSWWLPSRSSLPSSLSWPCCPLQKNLLSEPAHAVDRHAQH